jgi:hypothetical protein
VPRTVGGRRPRRDAGNPLDVAIRACGSLFGSRAKAATLLALAHGPLHIAAIARLTDTEHVSVLLAVDALADAGILVRRRRRNAFDMVGLDRAFPAHAQLRRLLRALAPPPEHGRVRQRVGMARATPRPALDAAGLFGYATLADVLLALSVVDEARPEWLRRVARIRKVATANRCLTDLVRMRVVRRRRQGRAAFYALDPSWPAARELRLLLRRLAMERPDVRAAASATRRIPRRHAERVGAERLLPFLRPAHARVLAALAHGTARAVDLASTFGVGLPAVRDTLLELRRAGAVELLVVRHKLHATLRPGALPSAFVTALEKMRSLDGRIAALVVRDVQAASEARARCRLALRRRVLKLFLAAADGHADPVLAARAAGTNATVARRWLREFVRDGSFHRADGLLALAPSLRDVESLKDALREMAASSP